MNYYIDEKERTKSFTKKRKPASSSNKKEQDEKKAPSPPTNKDRPSKELCCYKSVVTTGLSKGNKSPSHAALLASLDDGKPTVLNLYAGGGGKNS
jgi:hypothetical protein